MKSLDTNVPVRFFIDGADEFEDFLLSSLFKQFRVRARAQEDDGAAIQPVNQQKVSANMAFTVIGPIAFERMIQPLGAERSFIGNEQQHSLLQALEVVPTRAGQALPILEKSLGVVAGPGWRCPFTAGRLFRGHRTRLQLIQTGQRGP